MMYEVGETVLYSKNGVCLIEEITKKKIGSETIEYYVLKPLLSQVAHVFVPVNNEKLVEKIRHLHTAEEILPMLENSIEIEWESSKLKRAEAFKEIIATGDLQQLISLVKTLHNREKVLINRGKRLNISDERTLKDAEKMACGEIAVAFGIDKNEALEKILK